MAFLDASFRRSIEDIAARPRVAREAAIVVVAGAIVWAGATVVDPRAGWGLAWWALVAAMLITHLGMVEGLDGAPRAGLGLPNLLTLGRAALVPVPALVTGEPAVFAGALVVAFATDVLDGLLARSRDAATRFGVQADATVDIALVVVGAWAAHGAGWLPLWIATLVSVRYLAPPLLAALHYFTRAAPPPSGLFVHGRLPGAAVAVGLVALAAEPLRGAGALLVVAGTLGGLLTAGLSALRAYRQPDA